jgi:DNA-binding transcriptional LysR family regulator
LVSGGAPTGDRRSWLVAGVVLGVGLLNKPLPAFLAAGMLAGIAIAGPRRLLRVRGAPTHPGVRVDPVWEDLLVAALPAAHPLASRARVALSGLGELPLRMVARELNPPLVDLLLSACRTAGFEPRLWRAAGNDQDMLAAISAGPATWTVYYAAQAEMLSADGAGVAFVPVDPPLRMTTALAWPAAGSSPALNALVEACRAAGAD